MSTSVNIIPNNNLISVQDSNNQLTITNNTSNVSVDVTQPITNVVQVLTGPQGKKGDQGPIGPSGSVETDSFVTTSSFNSFTSSYNTGSFTGSFIGSLSGTASWAISASIATTASFVNLLAGPNITINYQSTGIAITASGGGGSGTPGGSDREIQYNSGSVFAGDSSFIFNYSSQSLQLGQTAVASGQYSHARGVRTVASGPHSHAEGEETQALGTGSHAEGLETIAYEDYQTAVGKYNDTTVSDCLFVVGAGTDEDRINGFSVRHDGSRDAPSITIPVGTTEPAYAVVGTMYYNPDLGLRFYDGAQWFTIGMST
jgi:hypothetical protein